MNQANLIIKECSIKTFKTFKSLENYVGSNYDASMCYSDNKSTIFELKDDSLVQVNKNLTLSIA